MPEPHTPETSRKHEVDAPPASPPSGKRLRTEQHKDDIKRAAIARSYDLPDQVSYRVLAESFADLKQYLIPESSSRSTIDFKNPDAVRVLNQAILAVHFDLCVILPPGNLCPTVANRLNYIKWLSTNVLLDLPPGPLSGLDVGTGASCIYPLLGVRYLPQSSFVGTDISKESVSVAIQNVTLSELHDRIDVFLNTDRLTTLPLNAPGFPLPKEDADGSVFTFSMCNPPFYEDNDERQRLKQMKHGMPSLSTTAKDGELFTQGGEEAFLTGMYEKARLFKERLCVG
ncbi:hypothetical protein H4R26_004412 [Coemansia thaxteri]|uniref:Uncharacterized protein n=1 Tax=Coemansia thaxteri TaxID=2663907 RepID=A0A9W8B9H8_9FUNG|nr:hypothetical protein H4R26_004412 [Coemansia thaxteri]